MTESKYIKSPFNWIGNKYQIIEQLQKIFPKNINCLVDYFCGGCDISINTPAKQKIGIDANEYLIDILKEFQNHSLEEILSFMWSRINEFKLSKENEEGYLAYREAYNSNPQYHTPLDLYTLTRFSFHFTMRFNKDFKMNAGFGRGYSNFSVRQQNSITSFHRRIQNVNLQCLTFKDLDFSLFGPDDFFYFDPPYLITNNVYNNGIKAAYQRWDECDERELLNYIKQLDERGLRFALSNVLYHRGKTNTILEKWVKDNNYNMYDINNKGYSHCTHTVPQDGGKTKEIIITNY